MMSQHLRQKALLATQMSINEESNSEIWLYILPMKFLSIDMLVYEYIEHTLRIS